MRDIREMVLAACHAIVARGVYPSDRLIVDEIKKQTGKKIGHGLVESNKRWLKDEGRYPWVPPRRINAREKQEAQCPPPEPPPIVPGPPGYATEAPSGTRTPPFAREVRRSKRLLARARATEAKDPEAYRRRQAEGRARMLERKQQNQERKGSRGGPDGSSFPPPTPASTNPTSTRVAGAAWRSCPSSSSGAGPARTKRGRPPGPKESRSNAPDAS